MLSYQHIYHAGNAADCHKHSVLAALLDGLRKDRAPFLYIDTHSGRGLYDFKSPEMQKLKEYEGGISKLWTDKDWPRPAAPYRRVLESLNRDGILRHYPGSPWIAEALRRPDDHILLYERHPQEHKALKSAMGRLPNTTILHEDGWTLDPGDAPLFKRGLIVIDPSYELKEEYIRMASRVRGIAQQYPGYPIAVWYPLLADRRHLPMTESLEQLTLPSLRSEIGFAEKGMTGSGLYLINPPPQFAETVETITDWLKAAL